MSTQALNCINFHPYLGLTTWLDRTLAYMSIWNVGYFGSVVPEVPEGAKAPSITARFTQVSADCNVLTCDFISNDTGEPLKKFCDDSLLYNPAPFTRTNARAWLTTTLPEQPSLEWSLDEPGKITISPVDLISIYNDLKERYSNALRASCFAGVDILEGISSIFQEAISGEDKTKLDVKFDCTASPVILVSRKFHKYQKEYRIEMPRLETSWHLSDLGLKRYPPEFRCCRIRVGDQPHEVVTLSMAYGNQLTSYPGRGSAEGTIIENTITMPDQGLMLDLRGDTIERIRPIWK